MPSLQDLSSFSLGRPAQSRVWVFLRSGTRTTRAGLIAQSAVQVAPSPYAAAHKTPSERWQAYPRLQALLKPLPTLCQPRPSLPCPAKLDPSMRL